MESTLTPIKALDELLTHMRPILHAGTWHYCAVAPEQLSPALVKACFALVHEQESVTLILPDTEAKAVSQYSENGWQRIELKVYSSLDAVGLTAAISQCLTQHQISANVVAGYHHDHVFVPQARAQEALRALQQLSAQDL